MTRGSVRSRQSSCPWPTSSAITLAAPRCSRTSVKPPVDAPTSSARRPVTSIPKTSSACASLTPPRPTYGWSGVDQLDDARRRRPACPAFETTVAVDLDLAGEDQRARPFARRGEPAFGHQGVEPLAWPISFPLALGLAAADQRELRGLLVSRPRGASAMAARLGMAAGAARRLRADDPVGDAGELAVAQARSPERSPRPGGAFVGHARASVRGRRATGRWACCRRRPCRRSSRARPSCLRRRGCRRRSGTRGRSRCAHRSHGIESGRRCAPPMIGAALRRGADERAGLAQVHRLQSVRVERAAHVREPDRPPADRSPGRRPCRWRRPPPRSPAAPAAFARPRPRSSVAGSRARSANASAWRPSPARIAMPSP